MTKNEQNRVVAWRLRIIREADELPRGVAQTCRHFGLSRKTCSRYTTCATRSQPLASWTRLSDDSRSGYSSSRPTMAQSSSPTSTGTWRNATSAMSTSVPKHLASTVRSSAHIGSTSRSSTSCSTKTASETISTAPSTDRRALRAAPGQKSLSQGVTEVLRTYTELFGAPGEIRTPDPLVRSAAVEN